MHPYRTNIVHTTPHTTVEGRGHPTDLDLGKDDTGIRARWVGLTTPIRTSIPLVIWADGTAQGTMACSLYHLGIDDKHAKLCVLCVENWR